MTPMRRIVIFVLLLAIALSFTSCGVSFGEIYDEIYEEKVYRETVNELFDAIDTKNEEAIYNLFSPDVQKSDKDLREQITLLLSVYQGPTDEIGKIDNVGGDYLIEGEYHYKSANTVFPIRSGDEYYWVELDLMYENTFNEDKVGITVLDFYTADEYVYRENEQFPQDDYKGLYVFAQTTLDCEIRAIGGFPYEFTPRETVISVDDVKGFLKTNTSFSDFVALFGEANVNDGDNCYYEADLVDGKPRYVEIYEENGVITSVDVVDDFRFIESIYEASE